MGGGFKFIVPALIVGVLVIAAAVLIILVKSPIPAPAWLLNRFAFTTAPSTYEGKGTLVTFLADGDVFPGGRIVREKPFRSAILGSDRALIVYLPPGYNGAGRTRYPVIYALHGFASRPQSWVKNLVPFVEKAILSGVLPPVVVVMPDFTISGDGKSDSSRPFDTRGGSWYINSNLGRYEDHFLHEIIPFAEKRFRVRTDPGSVALLGASMGGFAALYYGIRHPELAHILIPIYPAADPRYGVNGSKMVQYDPAGYAAIADDNPRRIVNKSVLGGLFYITEEWIYYPVFNSDVQTGSVWKDDLPVWRRLRDVSPADLLRDGRCDLRGQSYYILVGDRDDFNFHSHVSVIVPLLEQAGARAFPVDKIIPRGRHEWTSIEPRMDEMISWLGREIGRAR